jgi:hypothetical protein
MRFWAEESVETEIRGKLHLRTKPAQAGTGGMVN